MPDGAGSEAEVFAALRRLAIEDIASMEILLLDGLAAWIFSSDNPNAAYSEHHGGIVISVAFNAILNAPSWRPQREPLQSQEISLTRGQVLSGSHDLATSAHGVTRLIARLMRRLR